MSGSATGGQPYNVNTAAAQGVQQAQNFYSPAMTPAYMNPYEESVVGGLRNKAMENYQNQANQLGYEATRAGAFGGSRHGVAQGAMAAGVQNDLNNQIGNLRYQGYNNALNQASADQQMRLNASNLGFGMGQTLNNNLMVQGAMQQALQQMAMDRGSAQYANYQESPYKSLAAYTAAVGGTPYPQSTTNTQNTSRGLFDYLGMGLYGAGALGFTPFAKPPVV